MSKSLPHILVVCGKNRIRSLTAEHMFMHDPRFEIRSAGVSNEARHVVSQNDIDWAGLIVCMEEKHKERLVKKFKGIQVPPLKVIDVPDEYTYMEPELVTVLQMKFDDLLR